MIGLESLRFQSIQKQKWSCILRFRRNCSSIFGGTEQTVSSYFTQEPPNQPKLSPFEACKLSIIKIDKPRALVRYSESQREAPATFTPEVEMKIPQALDKQQKLDYMGTSSAAPGWHILPSPFLEDLTE